MSASVLPARAGMSPGENSSIAENIGAPRTGGDEPEGDTTGVYAQMCSPHGRG